MLVDYHLSFKISAMQRYFKGKLVLLNALAEQNYSYQTSGVPYSKRL